MKIYDYLNKFLIIYSFCFYDLLLNPFNLGFLHLLDDAIVILLFIVFLINYKKINRIIFVVYLLIIFMLFSMLINSSPILNFIYSLRHLMYIVVIFFLLKFVDTTYRIPYLKLIHRLIIINGIIGILQFLFYRQTGDAIVGLQKNGTANYTGYLYILSVFILFTFYNFNGYQLNKKKIIYNSVFAFILIILSDAKASLIFFIISVLLALIIILRKYIKFKHILYSLVLLLIFMSFPYTKLGLLDPFEQVTYELTHVSFTEVGAVARVQGLVYSYLLMLQQPFYVWFFGLGPGTYTSDAGFFFQAPLAMQERNFFEAIMVNWLKDSGMTPVTTIGLVTIWVELGIIGVTLHLLLFFSIYRSIKNVNNNILFIFLSMVSIFMMIFSTINGNSWTYQGFLIPFIYYLFILYYNLSDSITLSYN